MVAGGRCRRPLQGPRQVVLGGVDVEVAADAEPDRHCGGRFDRGAADLTIALRRVGVADAEQGALHLNRKVERRADAELLDVEVPADPPGRHHAVDARLGRCQPDHAAEELEGDADPVAERRPTACAELPDLEPGCRELVGEEAEAGDDRGPSGGAHLHRPNLNRENVARPGALDVNRPAGGVDPLEVEVDDGINARGGADLPGRGVGDLERQLGAGADGDDRLPVIGPVQLGAVDDLVNRAHGFQPSPLNFCSTQPFARSETWWNSTLTSLKRHSPLSRTNLSV